MSDKPLIILAGGGTGGHLYPGVAVAQELCALPGGADILFLCTGREIDSVILQPTGFEFMAQPIVPVVRSVNGLLRFWRKFRETGEMVKKVLRERKPQAVLGLGGYAAGVAVQRAAKMGIPTAILNPDAIPGKANQYLMRYSSVVCCQFDETSQYVSSKRRGKLVTTGCPIRGEILQTPPRGEAAGRLMIEGNLQTLVVTGASQGAKTINEAVPELLKGMALTGWQVLHLAGRDHAESVQKAYQDVKVKARVIDFTPAMADVWAVADLAISRSGASSCAEMTACGVPSILLPYPFHRDMHQRANALVLADAGAAVLVDDLKDSRKNAAVLKPVVESLLNDLPKRQAMAAAAKKLGRPDAAYRVAAKITEIISAGR